MIRGYDTTLEVTIGYTPGANNGVGYTYQPTPEA